jgi:hypothetical protein
MLSLPRPANLGQSWPILAPLGSTFSLFLTPDAALAPISAGDRRISAFSGLLAFLASYTNSRTVLTRPPLLSDLVSAVIYRWKGRRQSISELLNFLKCVSSPTNLSKLANTDLAQRNRGIRISPRRCVIVEGLRGCFSSTSYIRLSG